MGLGQMSLIGHNKEAPTTETLLYRISHHNIPLIFPKSINNLSHEWSEAELEGSKLGK